MMLYRDAEFEIDGKVYTVKPRNELLRKIEAHGVTIAGISAMAQQGNPQISYVAFFIWMMLKDGGYKGSEDDILGLLQLNPQAAMVWAETAMQAFTPVVDEKKPAPQAAKSKSKQAR